MKRSTNSRVNQRSHRRNWGYRHNRFQDNEAGSFYRGSEGTSDAASSSSSSSSSSKTSSTASELPGFYFDPEKNRYFRLLPGHNNCNPLTKEQLQEKEREKHRAMLLTEDNKARKKAPRAGGNTALLLQKRHLGLLPGNSYCRLVHEVKATGMKRHIMEIEGRDGPNTDTFRLIVGDSTSERVFSVSDVSHGGSKYSVMNLGSSSQGTLSVEMCDNQHFTNRKVNSICWASISHPDSHVLLCVMGVGKTPGSVTLLPASFCNSSQEQPWVVFSFRIYTAWSCAWCLNPQADKTFSTGLSNEVVVRDVETDQTKTFDVSSDVLAQRFAVRTPLLYNGCRSGEIFSIDLRQKNCNNYNWKATHFHQESAVTSIRILQDENYLLAADMLGQIKLWDVRVKKSVLQYKGHHNEHTSLPIHVNEPEGLLLAVGQDCYTRLWSLKDGLLLRTIPSPQPAAKDLIPSVVFSSHLGGCRGLPGLLMAVKQDLYYYPYTIDYQEGRDQQFAT